MRVAVNGDWMPLTGVCDRSRHHRRGPAERRMAGRHAPHPERHELLLPRCRPRRCPGLGRVSAAPTPHAPRGDALKELRAQGPPCRGCASRRSGTAEVDALPGTRRGELGDERLLASVRAAQTRLEALAESVRGVSDFIFKLPASLVVARLRAHLRTAASRHRATPADRW